MEEEELSSFSYPKGMTIKSGIPIGVHSTLSSKGVLGHLTCLLHRGSRLYSTYKMCYLAEVRGKNHTRMKKKRLAIQGNMQPIVLVTFEFPTQMCTFLDLN